MSELLSLIASRLTHRRHRNVRIAQIDLILHSFARLGAMVFSMPGLDPLISHSEQSLELPSQ